MQATANKHSSTINLLEGLGEGRNAGACSWDGRRYCAQLQIDIFHCFIGFGHIQAQSFDSSLDRCSAIL